MISARRAKHHDSTHVYILSCKHISRPIRARAYYLSYKYLLLAEFSVRTVNYGPRFFPSIYGPSAKRAGYKSIEKNLGPLFTVRTEKTRLIRCLLYGFFLFEGPETSAGRMIWQSFDRHQKGMFLLAHENNST